MGRGEAPSTASRSAPPSSNGGASSGPQQGSRRGAEIGIDGAGAVGASGHRQVPQGVGAGRAGSPAGVGKAPAAASDSRPAGAYAGMSPESKRSWRSLHVAARTDAGATSTNARSAINAPAVRNAGRSHADDFMKPRSIVKGPGTEIP